MFSLSYLEGVIQVFDGIFKLELVIGIVSEGIRDVIIGFAASRLSYLMTRNLSSQTVPV